MVSKHDEFRVKIDEFCIQKRNSVLKTRSFVFNTMNFRRFGHAPVPKRRPELQLQEGRHQHLQQMRENDEFVYLTARKFALKTRNFVFK